MADVAGRSGIKLESNNSYIFPTKEGVLYWFEVYYDTSATVTVTVSQGGSDIKDTGGNVIWQTAKLPSNPAADMAITATGVARGFDLRATARNMRFTTGTVSGDVYLKFGEVAHGRS